MRNYMFNWTIDFTLNQMQLIAYASIIYAYIFFSILAYQTYNDMYFIIYKL